MSLQFLVSRALGSSTRRVSSCCAGHVARRAFSTTYSVNAGFGLKDGVSSNFQSSRDESRPPRRGQNERSSYGRNSSSEDAPYKERSFDSSRPRRRNYDDARPPRGDRYSNESRSSYGLRPRVQSEPNAFLDDPEDGDSPMRARSERARPDRPQSPPSNQLFVGNIPFDATEADIREFFEVHGEIGYVRVGADADGRSRGFCHIQFTEQATAEKVMEEHGTEPLSLSNRQLRLDFAVGRPKRTSRDY